MPDSGAVEEAGTVSIELNFRAFADNVPASMHAKRAPSYGDPSVQDFADQALELAALRAELKRLTRDYEALQQHAQAREAQVETLRQELSAARKELREMRRQRRRQAAPPQAPVAAENSSFTSTTVLESEPLQKAAAQLIPLDPPGPAVALSRDIVTIGRASSSDVCIRSPGVSRDHARLLVTRSSVTLVDLGSTNGCFVNDVAVKRHRLRDGDVVRIGERSFRFASG